MIDNVEVNVGIPVAGFRLATGQLGLHAGPVTVVDNVTLCVEPEVNEAVTVADVPLPWVTLALLGLGQLIGLLRDLDGGDQPGAHLVGRAGRDRLTNLLDR